MLKQECLDHFGSCKAIAQALRISESAVSQWGIAVPEGTAYKLQVLTGGKLQVNTALYQKPPAPVAQGGR
jgi:DNA-binding transcriptional regulator YdaS (Cro superfamily)